MGEIVEFFSRPIAQFPQYPWWIYVATLIVITALTEVLKLPVKHFTDKIQNKSLRNKVNIVIVFIPVALAFAADGLFTLWGYSFSITVGFAWGGASQVLYEFISRLFARIKKGEDVTGEDVKEDFEDSVDDVKTAEKEFDDLIEKLKK